MTHSINTQLLLLYQIIYCELLHIFLYLNYFIFILFDSSNGQVRLDGNV